MSRRLHVREIKIGNVVVDPAQLHHARHVLRLADGASVELFDDAGRVGRGVLHGDCVVVSQIEQPQSTARQLVVAAAVPKGERADWMVEKLSELGVDEFIPLAAERSVSLPEGKGKRSRWERIAIESAKQSRRAGVMRIGPLSKPLAPEIVGSEGGGWYLSTRPDAVAIGSLVQQSEPGGLIIYIGPEGGWTEREMAAFDAANLTAVKLTDTILRVETAAVAAAAIVLAGGSPTSQPKAT